MSLFVFFTLNLLSLIQCSVCAFKWCVYITYKLHILIFYVHPLDLRLHPSSTVVCSCATAIAGAQFIKTPLFLHLSSFVPTPLSPPVTTNTPKRGARFTMPIPVVSALAGGQLLIGKLRLREFCFTPLSGTPFPEQVKMLVNVHAELGKSVQGKAGVSHGYIYYPWVTDCQPISYQSKHWPVCFELQPSWHAWFVQCMCTLHSVAFQCVMHWPCSHGVWNDKI